MIDTSFLQHTCTIQTDTGSDVGADGRTEPSWANTYTGVVCSFQMRGGGVEVVEPKEAALADFTLKLLPDQTISEAMRVTAVETRVGTTLFSGAIFKVAFVRPIEDGDGGVDHQVAYLEMAT